MKIYYTLLTLFLTTPAIAQWTSLLSGTNEQLNVVHAINDNNIFIAGNNGIAKKSTNGGTSFTQMNVSLSNSNINSLVFTSQNVGYSAGAGQEVFHTTNGGNTWTSLGGGITDLNDVAVSSVGDVWVCGDIEVGYGFLMNQTTMAFPMLGGLENRRAHAMCFINSNVYVVADSGSIVRSINNGLSWIQLMSGTTQQLNDVSFISDNNGIIVGNAGTILRTTNGGVNWQIVSSGSTQNLNAVYYNDADTVFIVGNNGVILLSSDGGASWTVENSTVLVDLLDIHGFSDNVWACGKNGTLIKRSGTTDISNVPYVYDINAYPNPVKNMLSVNIPTRAGACTLELYDIAGKQLKQIKVDYPTVDIDMGDFPSGVYLLQYSDINRKQAMIIYK